MPQSASCTHPDTVQSRSLLRTTSMPALIGMAIIDRIGLRTCDRLIHSRDPSSSIIVTSGVSCEAESSSGPGGCVSKLRGLFSGNQLSGRVSFLCHAAETVNQFRVSSGAHLMNLTSCFARTLSIHRGCWAGDTGTGCPRSQESSRRHDADGRKQGR
jgi:hypothetical protein